MRKAAYELMNIQLGRMQDVIDIIDVASVREKLSEVQAQMRAIIDEEYLMGSTNRKTCKTVRYNFVKNNPGLLDAAEKIIKQPIGQPLSTQNLFDNKYLRVVVTFVKDKLPDFRYFTYDVGDDRILVKVAGTPVNNTEENFDPTF